MLAFGVKTVAVEAGATYWLVGWIFKIDSVIIGSFDDLSLPKIEFVCEYELLSLNFNDSDNGIYFEISDRVGFSVTYFQSKQSCYGRMKKHTIEDIKQYKENILTGMLSVSS